MPFRRTPIAPAGMVITSMASRGEILPQPIALRIRAIGSRTTTQDHTAMGPGTTTQVTRPGSRDTTQDHAAIDWSYSAQTSLMKSVPRRSFLRAASGGLSCSFVNPLRPTSRADCVEEASRLLDRHRNTDSEVHQ